MRKPQAHAPRYRPSFTLVELLVAVSIMGILAGMVMFALLGAQSDARVARTRGTISKINEIVLQRWEEYRYKPVNVDTRPIADGDLLPRELARVRMLALRDAMRMEMPDRITDLLYLPTEFTMIHRLGTGVNATKLNRPIPFGYGILYESLRNNIDSLRAQGYAQWGGLTLNPLNSAPNPVPAGSGLVRMSPQSDELWQAAVQSGELLYLLVSTSQFSGSSALEFFRPTEVGDTDGDGLLEFIDAWGQPISWIRWPAGYPGDLVRYADDDAMDPLKTDWRYRPGVASDWHPRTLVPLIISAGPDEQFGVTFDFSNSNPIAYAAMTWPSGGTPPDGTNSGLHYSVGPYYYPDPCFTWDYQSGAPNGPNRSIPFSADPSTYPAPPAYPVGYRANQLGSIPVYLDAAQTIPNNVASDNVTSHDIILEP